MRTRRTRVEDAAFELNLAPLLDIIVSIVPMLLLSVVFVHITTIDTPVPQAVEKAMVVDKEKNQVQVQLKVSKQTGFVFTITDKGQTKETTVALKGDKFDLDGLHKETLAIKKAHPDVFRLELNPDETVPLDEIVGVMDHVRMITKDEPKVIFNDVDTGKPIETNLLFPDVVFGNVAGG